MRLSCALTVFCVDAVTEINGVARINPVRVLDVPVVFPQIGPCERVVQEFVTEIPEGVALLDDIGGRCEKCDAEAYGGTLYKMHNNPCNSLKVNRLCNNLIFSGPKSSILLHKMRNIAFFCPFDAFFGALYVLGTGQNGRIST